MRAGGSRPGQVVQRSGEHVHDELVLAGRHGLVVVAVGRRGVEGFQDCCVHGDSREIGGITNYLRMVGNPHYVN
ncbi:hypothetical protein CCO02nite_07160 [Cellulomonas composti]|uniref:Uncharacterized protein n=1 Tax=Cellulomonas composti TaxID=266130 RepID=A0A511J7V1_9CELL|nr:hypothetical protein CCO02nite_07160 [Cellulomonas composti]